MGQQIDVLLALKKDFSILLTGGSFFSPGLMRRVNRMIEEKVKLAAPGVTIKWAPLEASEDHPYVPLASCLKTVANAA